MKRKLIIVAIYLSGVLASYPTSRQVVTNMEVNVNSEYTTGDRAFCIVMSFGSWVNLFVCGVILTMQYVGDNFDEPAEW